MRRALTPLLFADEELSTLRSQRPPVDPATPSISAQRKKSSRVNDDGLPLHSFSTLLAELGSRCRVLCSFPGQLATFTQLTSPTPIQQRALELLTLVPSARKSR
jgi:hypothetical protein